MTTPIYYNNDNLTFDGVTLATKEHFELSDRCQGSIFEALSPGVIVMLVDGFYLLNEDLDLSSELVVVAASTFRERRNYQLTNGVRASVYNTSFYGEKSELEVSSSHLTQVKTTDRLYYAARKAIEKYNGRPLVLG